MPRRHPSVLMILSKKVLLPLLPPLLFFAACYLTIATGTQVLLRPFHLMAHLSTTPPLSPQETWEKYKPLFYRYQTDDLSPAFLAAMVQSLSSGVAWSPGSWNIRLSQKPWEVFTPENQEFGLMSFTPSSFEKAKSYCLHQHQPASQKPWFMLGGCWGPGLKTRASAADSIHVAAAYMQHIIQRAITERKLPTSEKNIHKFAAITHLCGEKSAQHFLKHHFKLHDLHSCNKRVLSPFFSTLMRHHLIFQKILKKERDDHPHSSSFKITHNQ